MDGTEGAEARTPTPGDSFMAPHIVEVSCVIGPAVTHGRSFASHCRVEGRRDIPSGAPSASIG